MTWDPIRLEGHLVDYHGLEQTEVGGLDSDDPRRLHARLHGTSPSHYRPHQHEHGDPARPVAPSS